jgi:hypothetical protein
MVRNRSHYGFLNRALRFCFILLMLTALNIPHLGMAAGMQEPATALMHAGQTHDAMTDAGNIHDKMGGPLCATLCLGTDRLEGPAIPQRVFRVRFVQWFGEIERAWPSVAPDAALRPPDPLRNA